MAAGEMSTECVNCGQRIRTGWIRCPRCRQLLSEKRGEVSAAVAGATSAPSRVWQGVTLAVVASIVVAAGIVAATSGTSSTSAFESTPSQAGGAVPRVAQTRPVDVRAVAQSKSADEGRAGYAAYASGDMASALTRFESAAETKPEDAAARNNLGQVLVRQNRAAEALPHFDAAVQIDSRKWAYRFNRARAYGVLDRWPEAVSEYRVAAQIFPDDYATHYNLGLALMKVKDYPAAVDELGQAVTQAPGELSFLITLGRACLEAQQLARANEVFQKFLALAAPDAPEVPQVKALVAALGTSGEIGAQKVPQPGVVDMAISAIDQVHATPDQVITAAIR
jgi:Flp pilus assembly protein TadD